MNRTLLRRISAALLSLALLFVPACSPKQDVAMEFEGHVITANEYRYWLSNYKATFLYTYADMTDTDASWEQKLTAELTAEQFLTEIVHENVKKELVCRYLFKEYGLSLPAEYEASVDAKITQLRTDLADGNEAAFNTYLSSFGINADMLREIYRNDGVRQMVYLHLYGEDGTGGIEPVTDADRDAYYRAHYSRVQIIYINNLYRYVTDKDGEYVYDAAIGDYQTEKLTDDEKAKKDAAIAAVESGIAAGESFEDLYNTHSESKTYPGGYYLTEETTLPSTELLSAAMLLEVGAATRVDTEYGTYFVKRYELDDGAYANKDNATFFETYDTTVAKAKFVEKINGYTDRVVIHDEIVSAYRLKDAAVDYNI